jgi:hypothetical protein
MGLQPFEGHDVISSGVEMPGASGGLNKALTVNNLELHHGDTVTLVIEAEVKKVRMDPIKETDALQRVHVLQVQNAATIEGDLVAEVLEQQRIRVEESRGVTRLDYTDEDPADDPDAPADGPVEP